MRRRLSAYAAALLLSAAAAAREELNVVSFGADPSGSSPSTPAVVAAVSSCAAIGGCVLYFPPGTYSVTPFNLTSYCELRLDAATLRASDTFSDWAIIAPLPSYGRGRDFPGPRYTSLIHGFNLTDVRITSNSSVHGVVDGHGERWWEAVKTGQLVLTPGHLVEFVWSSFIEIDRVDFRDSPFWNLHLWSSHDLWVHDLSITAPLHSTNTDGVDPDSSSNVLIENLIIANGDDGIAIKSGWAPWGVQYGVPTRNVTIRGLTVTTQSACVAIGSEMSGGIEDVVVRDVTCLQVRGCRAKMRGSPRV